MDLFLRCVAQRFSFFFLIQNFGPFSKGRGLDLQIFNKTSTIVDLFGKPLGQLWTLLCTTGSEVQVSLLNFKVVNFDCIKPRALRGS